VPLLSRLKTEDHVAGQFVPPAGKQRRRTEQHCHVTVMAAGVHLARDLRAVLAPIRFLDRQGVHVGAQKHRLAPGLGRAKRADHTRSGDAGPGFEAQFA